MKTIIAILTLIITGEIVYLAHLYQDDPTPVRGVTAIMLTVAMLTGLVTLLHEVWRK